MYLTPTRGRLGEGGGLNCMKRLYNQGIYFRARRGADSAHRLGRADAGRREETQTTNRRGDAIGARRRHSEGPVRRHPGQPEPRACGSRLRRVRHHPQPDAAQHRPAGVHALLRHHLRCRTVGDDELHARQRHHDSGDRIPHREVHDEGLVLHRDGPIHHRHPRLRDRPGLSGDAHRTRHPSLGRRHHHAAHADDSLRDLPCRETRIGHGHLRPRHRLRPGHRPQPLRLDRRSSAVADAVLHDAADRDHRPHRRLFPAQERHRTHLPPTRRPLDHPLHPRLRRTAVRLRHRR